MPDSGPCGPPDLPPKDPPRDGGEPSGGPLAGALSMAAQGFRVFPLSPGSKKPPEGFKWKALATTDAATIRSWATEYPGCNFGVRGGQGLIVLDPDGEAGRYALAELEAKHGKLPETLTVRTPGGGLHIYLSGADVSNARGALPEGIDVRGAGGYVVSPGSYFADSDGAKGYTGLYTIERAAPVADAPDWLPGLLRAAPVSQHSPEAQPVHEMDQPEDIDRAIRYLQNEAAPAIEGQRGDQRTYDVACEVRDFGVSEDTACQLMLEHYDPRCEPPWGEDGLAIKVGNAFAYAQNPAGSKSFAAEAASFAGAVPLDQIDGAADPHGRTSRFFSAADFAGKPVPPREWVVDGLVPFRTVTSLYGDGGLGKTLLAQQLAVAVATGTPWLGRPIMSGRVIFLTAEDDEDELQRRFADILDAAGLTFGDLAGLTVRSLAGEDALLATEDKLALTRTALFHELDPRAAAEGPVLVVIDTLADVYPSNENERVKVRQFIGILRGLALKRSCSVLLLAHPSLTGMSTGSGAGGSTAWNNSVRSRLYLTRAATPDGLPDNQNRRVLETMKSNYGPTGETISLTWQDGVFVVDEGAIGGLDGEARAALAERVFLDLLRLHTAQGRHVNPTSGPNYAPTVFAAHPDSQGVHKKGFSAAMEKLLKGGTLRIGQRGPQSRPVNFIEEVPK